MDSLEPCSVESLADLFLSFTHADSDLDESVGDSLVAAKLHELRGHRDTKLLSHGSDLLKGGLSAESRGKSMERLLGVHETLQLGGGIVIGDGALVLLLLLGSLLVGNGDGLIHLSLHLGGLETSLLNRELLVGELKESHIGVRRGLRHGGSSIGQNGLGEGVTALKERAELSLEGLTHIGSSLGLDSNLQVDEVIVLKVGIDSLDSRRAGK